MRTRLDSVVTLPTDDRALLAPRCCCRATAGGVHKVRRIRSQEINAFGALQSPLDSMALLRDIDAVSMLHDERLQSRGLSRNRAGLARLTLRDQSRCHLILKLGNAWRTSVCVSKDIEGEQVMSVLDQEQWNLSAPQFEHARLRGACLDGNAIRCVRPSEGDRIVAKQLECFWWK